MEIPGARYIEIQALWRILAPINCRIVILLPGERVFLVVPDCQFSPDHPEYLELLVKCHHQS